MNEFCPFFKEICKGNECVMFSDESCIVVSFLEKISHVIPSSEEAEPSSNIEVEPSGEFSRSGGRVPELLKTMTPEELAIEILEFKKREFPEDEATRFYDVSNLFWESKGVDNFLLPTEARIKIQRANILAERELEKEFETKRKERLLQEKEELPSLISQCIDWARDNGLKKVIVADVDAFIMEKNLDILPETKRAIYTMANIKMKSGK